MNEIIQYFSNMGLNLQSLLWTLGITLVGSILSSAAGRFVFGKRSNLSVATSSSIGILFVYALNIILFCAGAKYQNFVTPLPFVTIRDSQLFLFPFVHSDYTVICAELTGLILLAFLMNMIDRLFPRGENIITWLLFRCCAVILAQIGYMTANYVLNLFLTQGILTYAPTILLVILLLMICTGALKYLLGLFLTTVNPLIAAFYTFFFASIVGKQVTRAVLTTALLTGLFYLLGTLGITTVTLIASALVAYIPVLIILLILWYFLNKLF